MKVGIILLSPDGFYLDADGFLPKRPDFDKELLVELCRGQDYICSENTMSTLPKSITENATRCAKEDYDINLGIKTLHIMPPHLLIIVRSDKRLNDGKYFDLSDYRPLFKSKNLELRVHISS